MQRQPHPEARVAGDGLHRQITVVLVDDDAPRNIQTEAGALADRFGGEEGLEDPLANGRRYAGPVSPISTSTKPSSSPVRTVSVPVPCIAATALSMRFVQTWLSSAA